MCGSRWAQERIQKNETDHALTEERQAIDSTEIKGE